MSAPIDGCGAVAGSTASSIPSARHYPGERRRGSGHGSREGSSARSLSVSLSAQVHATMIVGTCACPARKVNGPATHSVADRRRPLVLCVSTWSSMTSSRRGHISRDSSITAIAGVSLRSAAHVTQPDHAHPARPHVSYRSARPGCARSRARRRTDWPRAPWPRRRLRPPAASPSRLRSVPRPCPPAAPSLPRPPPAAR